MKLDADEVKALTKARVSGPHFFIILVRIPFCIFEILKKMGILVMASSAFQSLG